MTESSPAHPAGRYAERLAAPVGYWVIGLLVGVSSATAIGFYLGPWVAVAAGVVVAGGVASALLYLGHPRIVVDGRGLSVGPSVLEWRYQGDARPLDRAQTRDRLGVGADTRAFVVARPYVRTAVEVEVRDAADPHPYWLISTRNPQRLAAALAAGRSSGAA